MANPLTKKYGPLEGWQWLVIGGGGALMFYLYESNKEESATEGITPEEEEKLLGALSGGGTGGGIGSGGGTTPVSAPEVNLSGVTEGLTGLKTELGNFGLQQREAELTNEAHLNEQLATQNQAFTASTEGLRAAIGQLTTVSEGQAAAINELQNAKNNPPIAGHAAAVGTTHKESGLVKVTNAANKKYGTEYRTVTRNGVTERIYYRNGKQTTRGPVSKFTAAVAKPKAKGSKKPTPIAKRISIHKTKPQPVTTTQKKQPVTHKPTATKHTTKKTTPVKKKAPAKPKKKQHA